MKTKTLALTFLMALSAQAEVLDRVLAVVGQQPILQSELRTRKKQLQSSKVLASIYGIDATKLSDESLLDKMIEEKIIENSTQELDIKVSDSDVSKQIENIAKMNGLNRKGLEASLKTEGIPLDAYENNIRLQLQRRNIFEREIRKAGGVGEAEIREIYRKRAKREYKIWILEIAEASKQAIAFEQFRAGKITFEQLRKEHGANDLGWTEEDSLRPEFRGALSKTSAGSLTNPVEVGGQKRLVFVESERIGSEAEFQKMKAQLTNETQAVDYEKRFQYWLERKKREMHIVVNKS